MRPATRVRRDIGPPGRARNVRLRGIGHQHSMHRGGGKRKRLHSRWPHGFGQARGLRKKRQRGWATEAQRAQRKNAEGSRDSEKGKAPRCRGYGVCSLVSGASKTERHRHGLWAMRRRAPAAPPGREAHGRHSVGVGKTQQRGRNPGATGGGRCPPTWAARRARRFAERSGAVLRAATAHGGSEGDPSSRHAEPRLRYRFGENPRALRGATGGGRGPPYLGSWTPFRRAM